jgi:flavin reductase (DIM6/NTAB) family NADH-FMN oxidoreductase RutF
MDKVAWKPGTMVYPLPVVMVSCGTMEGPNIITIAWTGTICTDPAMTYISVRPERHSYEMIRRTREFAINLTTEKLAFAVDFCGVKSGRDIDKFKALDLTPAAGKHIKAPIISESPLNIECSVTEIKQLGSHHMFLARVLGITADTKYINKDGAFQLNRAQPICYSHGKYYALGRELGRFGFSVQKKTVKKRKK